MSNEANERDMQLITLVREGLSKGISFKFKVQSDSMRPFIMKGDIVTVDSSEMRRLKTGDVILFQSGSLMIVHRMLFKYLSSGNDTLRTKGDAAPRMDAPIDSSMLLGRVREVERSGVRLNLDNVLFRTLSLVIAAFSPLSGYFLPAGARVKSLLRKFRLVKL